MIIELILFTRYIYLNYKIPTMLCDELAQKRTADRGAASVKCEQSLE